MGLFTAVDVVFLGIGAYLVRSFLKAKTNPPSPPGPKPLPFIGNLKDLPPPGVQEHLHWSKHKKLYGPISSVTVFGTTIVIINDLQTAYDTLDKRSAIYSDRPPMTLASELVGWEDGVALQMNNDIFRRQRKDLHTVIGSKDSVANFFPVQEAEVRRFCLRLLEAPEDLFHHIRTEAGAIILNIAYGYKIEPRGADPLVDLVDTAMQDFSQAGVPGAWVVDQLPILKYIPEWFPGAAFKRSASKWRKTLMRTANLPYAFVKHQMDEGTAAPSYTKTLLTKRADELTKEDEHLIKWSAASMYTGGGDTTVAVHLCFFLAMALYPEAQRKAQKELDEVVGTDRLPTFSDRKSLLYVEALMKEVHRWHPIGPLGLPHVTSKEDIYNGYLIPKGAIIMPNIYDFCHDPDIFHDPEAFLPERFLGPNPEPDPRNIVFGFGRRTCPGRELADSSIFLNIATSLAAFDILKPVVDGKEVEPHVGFMPGVISHPEPYDVRIVPRSDKAAELVRAVEEEYPFGESDARALQNLIY